jgi:hypothetical protein
VRCRLYKVSSLANGQVSLVFHVEESDAGAALAMHHLRGHPVRLAVESGWDD